MQQYFLDQSVQCHETVEMNEEQAHHIRHVLRMKENTRIRIVDENQCVYFAHVLYENEKTLAYIEEAFDAKSESSIQIRFLMGLIKQEKWDYCIQKCCEAGVNEIIPFVSKRSVVKIKEDKNDNKLKRWNKIALEACEQSKRSHCVTVAPAMSLKEALNLEADLKLIAYECADVKGMNLASVLRKNPHIQSVLICVGCEGGFDPSEVEEAIQKGFICVSLGPRILRAETAAVSMINYLTYHYDMLEESYENAEEIN